MQFYGLINTNIINWYKKITSDKKNLDTPLELSG